MKKTDYFGIAFLVLLALLIVFFPVNHTFLAKLTRNGCIFNGSFEWTGFTLKGLDQFGNVTKAAPYLMGFLKFALREGLQASWELRCGSAERRWGISETS